MSKPISPDDVPPLAGDIHACFSQTYAQARDRFLAAAEQAGLSVQSHVHPQRGRDGEALAMDVVLDGAIGAQRLLVLSSACHGVEGFCGSGVQIALLRDPTWRDRARAANVAVLYLHALNPHGFSWWRRVTHENVDLNRNFQDFTRALPANPGYDQLADLLVPASWPPPWHEKLVLAAFICRHGYAALKQAVSAGQYTHPQGLFYGGDAPTWSQITLRQVLREHGAGAAKVAWIDLHSGLGPQGVGERMIACREDDASLARAQAWWGHVTSFRGGNSSSADLTGLMWTAVYEECPQAEYTGITLEYGTLPTSKVIRALRADQWLQLHPQAPTAQRKAIKRQIRDAFYVDRDDWKRRVITQGRQVACQALVGLGRAPVRN